MSKETGIETNETVAAAAIGNIIYANVSFTFRPQVKDEELTRIEGAVYHEHETNSKGETVFEEDGVTPKLIMARKQPAVRRAPVVAEIPYPTLAYFGIPAEATLDSNGFPVYETRELNALFALVRDRVESAARDTLENSATVDLDKVDWAVIAAKPKRSSSAVSKEDLDAFIEAFTQWATAANKPAKGIKIQAQLFKTRCRGVENIDNKAINRIAENIVEFISAQDTAAQSDYAEVAEFLGNKLSDAAMSEEDLATLL